MDIIDKIRELGIERDLQGGIPQIAVMGDQSSGKSSVHLLPCSRSVVPSSCPATTPPERGPQPFKCQVLACHGGAKRFDATGDASGVLPQVLEALSGVQFPRGTGLVT